jgi:hypothetical protein
MRSFTNTESLNSYIMFDAYLIVPVWPFLLAGSLDQLAPPFGPPLERPITLRSSTLKLPTSGSPLSVESRGGYCIRNTTRQTTGSAQRCSFPLISIGFQTLSDSYGNLRVTFVLFA